MADITSSVKVVGVYTLKSPIISMSVESDKQKQKNKKKKKK